jgi:hypothetical protein
MPFDFLKKKGNTPNKSTQNSEPKKATTSSKEQGFESQSEALKPKDDKGKKGGFLAGLSNMRDNIDKSSLGKAFGTPGWYKNQWQGVEDAVKLIPMNPKGMKWCMEHHRDLFRQFCAKEMSDENLDLYEALTENKVNGQTMSKKEVYETYLALGSALEANFPQSELKTLHELAKKGEFSKMDFSPLINTAADNLSDPFGRFHTSDEFRRGLFFKMTGVQSPTKVGGVKGE